MSYPLVFESVEASAAGAIMTWPILLPLYELLSRASYELRDFPPCEARLGRMADAVRDLIIDAELGMLGCSPEQRIKRIREASSGL